MKNTFEGLEQYQVLTNIWSPVPTQKTIVFGSFAFLSKWQVLKSVKNNTHYPSTKMLFANIKVHIIQLLLANCLISNMSRWELQLIFQQYQV